MCWFLFKKRVRGEWSEANQAMGDAAQAFEGILDTFTTGDAGILVKPASDQDAHQARLEIERALGDLPSADATWSVVIDETETPHPWVIITGSALPAVAGVVDAAGRAMVVAGLGARVLAAVYGFTWKEQKLFWIYQPRIKAFTPFVPARSGQEERDHPLELRMEHAIRKELPTSRDIKEWYPIWGIPL